jgi:hypothetical protein
VIGLAGRAGANVRRRAIWRRLLRAAVGGRASPSRLGELRRGRGRVLEPRGWRCGVPERPKGSLPWLPSWRHNELPAPAPRPLGRRAVALLVRARAVQLAPRRGAMGRRSERRAGSLERAAQRGRALVAILDAGRRALLMPPRRWLCASRCVAPARRGRDRPPCSPPGQFGRPGRPPPPLVHSCASCLETGAPLAARAELVALLGYCADYTYLYMDGCLFSGRLLIWGAPTMLRPPPRQQASGPAPRPWRWPGAPLLHRGVPEPGRVSRSR